MRKIERRELILEGSVQGVGLRWFAKTTAERIGLTGWVENQENGTVTIEVQGPCGQIDLFCEILQAGRAFISVEQMQQRKLPLEKEAQFIIR